MNNVIMIVDDDGIGHLWLERRMVSLLNSKDKKTNNHVKKKNE